MLVSSREASAQHRITPLRVLFFCGERSQWGYSHLVPLLSEPYLELVGVILATEERWATFRTTLSGEARKPLRWKSRVKRVVKALTEGRPINRTRDTLTLLRKHGVPVLICDDANSPASAESFREFRADLSFCAAYPQIFKSEILSLCSQGAFNSHAALLPRCRGGAPVFWAIASGETESGATIHYMTRDVDRGDIVAQIAVDMLPTETYSELNAKLVGLIPALVSQFVDFAVTPGSSPIPQDHARATYFRRDRRIHRRVFWSEMTATQICNLIRACDGRAYCWVGEKKIKVLQARRAETNKNMTNSVSVPPGTIVDIVDKVPVVAARTEFVSLESLVLPRLRKVKFEIGQILH